MQKVFIAGHPMAYRRSGRGEPVLLVHGFSTHSFLWRDVAPKLAERFDVVAVDLLGCGASARKFRKRAGKSSISRLRCSTPCR